MPLRSFVLGTQLPGTPCRRAAGLLLGLGPLGRFHILPLAPGLLLLRSLLCQLRNLRALLGRRLGLGWRCLGNRAALGFPV